MPSHLIGIDGKIADCFNEVSELNQRMADELKHIRSVVGKEALFFRTIRFDRRFL